MNRPLLIVICDFLLISLLSLAKFEPAQQAESLPSILDEESPVGAEDMVAILKNALASERQSRDSLAAMLDDTQASLASKTTALEEKESRIAVIENNLKEVEGKAIALQAERRELQQQFTSTQQQVSFLQEQYVKASEDARKLQKDLNQSERSAVAATSRLETIEQELTLRREEVISMQAKMDSLEKERRQAEEQKFQLALELKQSQTTEIIIREQFDAAKDEIKEAREDVAYSRDQVSLARAEIDQARQETSVVREEKARIERRADQVVQGVGELSEQTARIERQLTESQTLTPSSLYEQYLNGHRLQTRFKASRSGTFGQVISREQQTHGILVQDADRLASVYHINQTPFELWSGSPDWEQISGRVQRGASAYSATQLGFLKQDPRVLVMPVGARQSSQLGIQAYALAKDPLAYSRLTLINGSDDAYGEIEFRISASHPDYLEMDVTALDRLIKPFTPTVGDVVINPAGQLVGIMVNDRFCMVIRGLEVEGSIQFGSQPAGTGSRSLLVRKAEQLNAMPRELK